MTRRSARASRYICRVRDIKCFRLQTAFIDKEDIHLAIVDIMMPRMDGIRMTMKLREKHDFPVIMLSAKSEEVDKITGLNIGADDYVTKPFTPMELMARVNSQLRRYRKFLEKLAPQENVHVIGGLERRSMRMQWK